MVLIEVVPERAGVATHAAPLLSPRRSCNCRSIHQIIILIAAPPLATPDSPNYHRQASEENRSPDSPDNPTNDFLRRIR